MSNNAHVFVVVDDPHGHCVASEGVHIVREFDGIKGHRNMGKSEAVDLYLRDVLLERRYVPAPAPTEGRNAMRSNRYKRMALAKGLRP